MRARTVITIFGVCSAACGGTDITEGADAGIDASSGATAVALFQVPRGAPPADGFYALPYPTDIRLLDDQGRIDLSDHPQPTEIFSEYLDTIEDVQRYFGLSSAIYVRFEAPIDPASLPTSPGLSLSASSSVYLVDVDPQSPERGRRVPLEVHFSREAGELIGENWLAALPYPGFVLAEERQYALVVTRRVLGADGRPIERSPDFDVIAGDVDQSDADLARARDLFQPLWAYLDEAGGDERSDVAVATVFTTQNATGLLGDIREVVWDELELPEPREVSWEASRDGYLRFGGVFDTPIFQRGDFPYLQLDAGGSIAVDEDQRPQIQRLEEIRFVLTVPRGSLPEAGWPVVLYAHGTGGDAYTPIRNGTAERLAEVGIACLSIDQLMHGDRSGGTNPALAFFNYRNPRAARGNVLQSALDDFQLLRLALSFDFTERHPRGRTIRLDRERIYFFGHSQGSVTGTPFLAREPLVKGAVLSGAGGLLYLTMLSKTKPFDVTSLLELLLREELDEFNPGLALLQAFFDASDSASYGRLLVRQPPEGFAPKNIFQIEGFVDGYTPIPTIEALATAIQVDQITPVVAPIEGLEIRERATLTPPVSLNAGSATAVVAQYEAFAGEDGHFVAFDIASAQRQSIEFFATHAETGVATVVEP